MTEWVGNSGVPLVTSPGYATSEGVPLMWSVVDRTQFGNQTSCPRRPATKLRSKSSPQKQRNNILFARIGVRGINFKLTCSGFMVTVKLRLEARLGVLRCIVMGLSSKRKGRWRYRFWQKMFLTLIGLPLLVGLVLGFVAIFRAVFVTQLDGSMLHIIDDQETQDIVDESQSMERAERLAGALKIATISYDTDHQENENLLAFIKYLEKGRKMSTYEHIQAIEIVSSSLQRLNEIVEFLLIREEANKIIVANNMQPLSLPRQKKPPMPYTGPATAFTSTSVEDYSRHEYLAIIDTDVGSFPLIHNRSFIKREVINKYSLLFTVQGLTRGKLPYLLASHLDVVPVDAKAWEFPPFSGRIVNRTYVYGRGAIDDKAGVMGIMEAVEYMLQKKQRPQRTFFMAFGHDEEVSGKRGAQELAKTLIARGVDHLDFVLDEGFPLHRNLIPGTDRHVAMVGISEKGTATLELSVIGTPGHSSFPPAESAIGILAAAVAKLEENQQPSLLGKGPESAMFRYLAPHVSFGYRILYNNLWLFSGLMAREMEHRPITNAIVRTTSAITMFNGGIKSNVIPPSAKAVINHRVHPAQSVAEVIAHDRKVIDDPRVDIRVKISREAHPVSPFGPTSIPFQMVAASIRQIYPDAIVVPAVFIANTDTRWYLSFTSNLYRFLPTVILPSDVNRYHGNNERISIHHYYKAVSFYYRLIKNADVLIDQVPASTVNNGEEEL
uniref:Peptidase M20 dimerisation domain-containing protein n=1 Tax=Timema douglasi TaxID=61478 RepID=A0A7R8Z8G6_TIMDO|nr:unnamed protein product [Timema douglasi]